jgi:hypothetical protein
VLPATGEANRIVRFADVNGCREYFFGSAFHSQLPAGTAFIGRTQHLLERDDDTAAMPSQGGRISRVFKGVAVATDSLNRFATVRSP